MNRRGCCPDNFDDEVRQEIGFLGILAKEPIATVVIQAIDHRPTVAATVALDWVDRYDGSEARNRRVPIDTNEWNGTCRSELFSSRSVDSLVRIHSCPYRRRDAVPIVPIARISSSRCRVRQPCCSGIYGTDRRDSSTPILLPNTLRHTSFRIDRRPPLTLRGSESAGSRRTPLVYTRSLSWCN